IARSDSELNNSVGDANSTQKIQYVFNWAKNTSRTFGVDMVDEVNFMWGDNPTPTDGRWLSYTPYSIPDNAFTTLMNIINGVSGRSMIGWPAAGGASTVAVQNWQGN